jgi:hypothetical protein
LALCRHRLRTRRGLSEGRARPLGAHNGQPGDGRIWAECQCWEVADCSNPVACFSLNYPMHTPNARKRGPMMLGFSVTYRALYGALLLNLVAASGCVAPVSRDLQFGATSQTALIVLVTPREDFPSIAAIHNVDLASQRFAPDGDAFDIAMSRPSQLINRDTQSNVWLSMREVEPGDYALVEVANGSPAQATFLCLDAGAPVYRVSSGEILIISTWSWYRILNVSYGPEPSTYVVDEEFERVRARYPSIAGEPSRSQPIAAIEWPRRRGGNAGNRHCSEGDEFRLSQQTP